MKYFFYLSLLLSCVLIVSACGDQSTPKPRGYFRIDLPETHFVSFDTTYPFTFEHNDKGIITPFKRDSIHEPYWINIEYPMFKGTLFLSYKKIQDNLQVYIADSWEFVNKHIPKADAIIHTEIFYPENRVYGLSFKIHGSAAASPAQFYVSDSTTHFLRGALYFDAIPNNDSLQPVIEFITHDMEHLLKTLKWKD